MSSKEFQISKKKSVKNALLMSLSFRWMVFTQGIFRTPCNAFRKYAKKAKQDLSNHADAQFNDCFPLEHFFTDGIYSRKITIPQGVTLIGKIHKHEHPIFLISGHLLLRTESGDFNLHGPQFLISKPGEQRIAYAVTEIEWITVHANPTGTRDLEKLEKQIIAPSFESFDRFQLKHNIISFFKQLFTRRLS